MEFLTRDHVNEVADKMLRTGGIYRYLHPTAVPYIIEILTPYANIISEAQQIDDLGAWIKAYHDDISGSIRLKLLKAINTGIDDIRIVQSDVVDVLIIHLITMGEERALHYGSVVILPWDIAESGIILRRKNLQEMFPDITDQLPVTFMVENNAFVHNVTEEFVAGLVDTYLATGKYPPLIMIYGKELPFDYTWTFHDYTREELQFHELKDRRHNAEGRYQYTAWYKLNQEQKSKLPENDRAFNTMDYLQGATTAAQWQELDVHSLIYKVTNRRYQELAF